MARIDLSSVSREEFNITEKNGRFLIVPKKGKHIWAPDERHLRSLLVDADGCVLSSGLPKVHNLTEDPDDDAAFLAAMKDPEAHLYFREKLDGSLIILSVIDGKPHLRTRGSHDLGSFEEPVMRLIEERYGMLLPWLDFAVWNIPEVRGRSFLFEYTGPENQIVIRYEKGALTYLGSVEHEKLTFDPFFAQEDFALCAGISAPKLHRLPSDLNEVLREVKGWTNGEGIVATYTDGGRWRMVKIKSEHYVRLHAFKFRLSGKVAKLAYLLDALTAEEVRDKFFGLGIDAEAQAFVQPEIDAYAERVKTVTFMYQIFRAYAVSSALGVRFTEMHEGHAFYNGHPQHRKAHVQYMKDWIASNGYPPCYFNAAMLIYDGKTEDAFLSVVAREVLNESPNVVKGWKERGADEVMEMFSTPVLEDA